MTGIKIKLTMDHVIRELHEVEVRRTKVVPSWVAGGVCCPLCMGGIHHNKDDKECLAVDVVGKPGVFFCHLDCFAKCEVNDSNA